MLVGFSDGYVRGYSKSGQRVLAQSMHTEAVNKLTCMAPSGSQLTSNSNQVCVCVCVCVRVCVRVACEVSMGGCWEWAREIFNHRT